jgi:hypothetical protein
MSFAIITSLKYVALNFSPGPNHSITNGPGINHRTVSICFSLAIVWSTRLEVPYPFVDRRKGIARIAIDSSQSPVNFGSGSVLLPEEFDDASLLDPFHCDIINVHINDKPQMPAKIPLLLPTT